MAKQNQTALQNKIAQLHNDVVSGAGGVISQAIALARKEPKNSIIAHLAAFACKNGGELEKAEQYFLRSLSLNPNQPEVHNNLANMYRELKRYDKAIRHYKKALKQRRDFSEARKNFALTLLDVELYDQALVQLFEQTELYPKDPVAHKIIGDCHRLNSDFINADDAYSKAISLNRNYPFALHNRGLSRHLQGRIEDALQDYLAAYQLQPEMVELSQSLANTLHQLNRTDESLLVFRKAISYHSSNCNLHERLNEILWEIGRKDVFGVSFEQAIIGNPANMDLRVSFFRQLMRAKQLDRLKKPLLDALDHFGEAGALLDLQAQLFAEQGNNDLAHNAFEKALTQNFNQDLAQRMIKLCIVSGEWQYAQSLLDRLLKQDELCQMNWALQSIVWRVTGNDKYGWLNNYDQFVGVFTLPTPAGYDSLSDFLKVLQPVLEKKHQTLNSPLNQTLVEGTQTAARLFFEQESEIRALKASIETVIDRYIIENIRTAGDNEIYRNENDEGERKASGHPLLSRRSAGFEISGSWSVKLRPNGFHVNHVHPEGWISSSFYVSLPELDSDNNQGAIKFGESPFRLGEKDVPEKIIRPKAGMVVLFPSYMWHGTFPFQGNHNAFRLTAPFDVIPSNS